MGSCAAVFSSYPEFHHGGSLLQDRGFCDTVSGWQTGGHEIVLHGYFHDRRESPPEKLSTLFWTRLYTNREAEFLDLPREAARQRLEKGRSLFASLGWRATRFCRPGMADGFGPDESPRRNGLRLHHARRRNHPASARPQPAQVFAIALLQPREQAGGNSRRRSGTNISTGGCARPISSGSVSIRAILSFR